MNRKIIIGLIGPNSENCTKEIYDFGYNLGKQIADKGYILVSGGREGIMEAAFKGAHSSDNYVNPVTIAILPSTDKNEANKYSDIIIPTGIGLARNSIIPNTADILIAVAGGAGTLSEIAFAWQFKRYVICYTGFEGWAKELAGIELDNRSKGLLKKTASINEMFEMIEELLII